MRSSSSAAFIIFLATLSGCQNDDTTMWGNAELKGDPQGCHASYFVVGNSRGDPHCALVLVHIADIAAPRFSAALSSDAIVIDGNRQPLPSGFIIFANSKDGSLKSFPGTTDMKTVLAQGATPTKTDLIRLVHEGITEENGHTQ